MAAAEKESLAQPTGEADRVSDSGSRRKRGGAGEVDGSATTVHADGGPPRFGADTDPTAEVHGPAPLAPGTKLKDVYEVVARKGQGGMGAVYEVEHVELRKRLAAKVVTPAMQGDAESVARLRNEARTLAGLEHENIVRVTDLGETADGLLFVIMELLDGQDLRERLRTQAEAAKEGGAPWLPDEEVRTLVPQVLSALSAAHTAEVIHRDLKPDNVFLARRGDTVTVKVLDFGISKVTRSDDDPQLTKTGQIIGTPLYMAPEQGRSSATVDVGADIYSLGCLLYELVTGRPPFSGANTYECLLKHATERPRPPTELRPDLPAGVDALILRCLEKEPSDRFATVDEVADAWGEAWDPSEEEPAGAVAVAGTAPPAQASARQWIGPAVAVLVLGGAAGLVAWSLSGERDEPTPAQTEPVAPAANDRQLPSDEVEPVLTAETDAPAPSAEGVAEVEPTRETTTVRSIPDGAMVYVDGERMGVSPVEVPLPPDGSVRVELRLTGYRTKRVRVDADSAEETVVQLVSARGVRSKLPALAPQHP